MAKGAPPSSLDTWFMFVGDSSPVLEETPVTVILRSTGEMLFTTADKILWSDVYAWHFGDET